MDATLTSRLADITQLAAAMAGAPVAAVTRVDEWDVRMLAGVGVPVGGVLARDASYCPGVVAHNAPTVIRDTRLHALGAVPGFDGRELRFYAGWPLTIPGQRAVGTLCVFDHRPRRLGAGQRRALGLLARQAAEQLEHPISGAAAEQLRDDFIALVSHEVRTPLAAIQGYVEMLLDDLPTATHHQMRFASGIESNVRRLVRLIDQLLLTASVTGGGVTLRTEHVDLASVASAAVAEVGPLAESTGVRLATRTVGERRSVEADRSLLTQAVDNLVRNGVRFSRAGGLVEVLLGGASSVVEVVDTGVGIPLDEQEYVFDRFYRGAYARLHAVPGAGLGLALVKAVAEAHGGAVRLSSSAAGTRVGLILP